MEFKRYPSLVNPQNNPRILEKINYIEHDQLFCLSEKVHGANFTFMTQEQNNELKFEMAKRTTKLQKDDDFFKEAVNQIKNKYKNHSLELFNYLKENLNQELKFYKNVKLKENQFLKSIYIYGELFGGYYPHPNVSNYKNKQRKIQDGVYYSNENDFYAFDLVLILSDENGKQDELWLCPQHMEKLFLKFGFEVYAKALHVGSVMELMEVDYHVNTIIPQTFFKHLPLIENNTCEGMVLRPYNVSKLNHKPMVFKLKNHEFLEKTTKQKKKLPKKYEILFDKEIAEKLDLYLNDNRVDSAISKIGKPNKKSKDYRKVRGMIIGEVCKDVLQIFQKDEKNLWDKILELKQEKMIKKYVSDICGVFVLNFDFQ